MDDSNIIDHLRSQADGWDDGGTDVDALVRGALVQGHRRRIRRRVGAGLTAVVVAGIVGAVVATGVPSALRGSPDLGPAGVPVSAVPSAVATSALPPEPSTPTSPSPSSPATPATTGVVDGSPSQVRTTLTDLVPVSFTVTSSTSSRDEGSNSFPFENSAAVTLQDAKGTSYLNVSIGSGSFDDGCMNLKPCSKTTLPDGGIIWVTGSPSGDKAGPDRNFSYDRADGGHIFLMERTSAEGNGPVTRPSLPLTDAEGRALVSSSRWDDLFRG